MSWPSEMLKLEYKHIWLCVLIFLCTIAAGFLVVFHFKPELVEKYDIFKLVVLSLALTLPLLSINAVTAAFLYDRLPDDYESETAKNVDITRGALMLNAIVIYVALLVCYFASLNFNWFLGIVAGLEMFMLIVSVFFRHILKADKTAK
jgi:multisubunit Na+/H+ antiporter MnhC subunit